MARPFSVGSTLGTIELGKPDSNVILSNRLPYRICLFYSGLWEGGASIPRLQLHMDEEIRYILGGTGHQCL